MNSQNKLSLVCFRLLLGLVTLFYVVPTIQGGLMQELRGGALEPKNILGISLLAIEAIAKGTAIVFGVMLVLKLSPKIRRGFQWQSGIFAGSVTLLGVFMSLICLRYAYLGLLNSNKIILGTSIAEVINEVSIIYAVLIGLVLVILCFYAFIRGGKNEFL